MDTIYIQELSSIPVEGIEVRFEPPQALTPEVLAFMAMLCFLAACGSWQRR